MVKLLFRFFQQTYCIYWFNNSEVTVLIFTLHMRLFLLKKKSITRPNDHFDLFIFELLAIRTKSPDLEF